MVESLKGYNKPGTTAGRIVSTLEDEKRRAKKYDEAKENTFGKTNESASSSVLRRKKKGSADSRLENDSLSCSSACDSRDSGCGNSSNNNNADILQVINEYHDNYPALQKAVEDSERAKNDLGKEAEGKEEVEEPLETTTYEEILTIAGSVVAAVVILFLFILSLVLVVKARQRQRAADGHRDSGRHYGKK